VQETDDLFAHLSVGVGDGLEAEAVDRFGKSVGGFLFVRKALNS
jgi:hypothetical protein